MGNFLGNEIFLSLLCMLFFGGQQNVKPKDSRTYLLDFFPMAPLVRFFLVLEGISLLGYTFKFEFK